MIDTLNKLLLALAYLEGDRPVIVLDEKNRRFEIEDIDSKADQLTITLRSDDEI